MAGNPSWSQNGEYHLPPGTDVMVGDFVAGPGILPGTTVTSVSIVNATPGGWNSYAINPTYIVITLAIPVVLSYSGISNHTGTGGFITGSFTGLDYGGWSTTLSFSRIEVVTMPDPVVLLPGATLSFREDVKGWVSFKSFTLDNAISVANEYYSFTSFGSSDYKKGLWKHHDESVNRNSFSNVYTESSFSVIFNDVPGSVKSFKTINYEGSQARILEADQFSVDNGLVLGTTTISDGEYYNLIPSRGWFVNSTFTNLENGGISEFIEKEGKWFGYFTGVDVNVNGQGLVIGDYNTSDFNVQGIGTLVSVSTAIIYGCMDELFFNYNAIATISNDSCIPFVYGCIDTGGFNFDAAANTDDGSCIYLGCIDSTAFNFDVNANTDDGSCIAVLYGCTDPAFFNYNQFANSEDPVLYACVPYIYSCIDPLALNFDAAANTDDGSCTYGGCMDALACNYNSGALTDDGTCVYCGDTTAVNYDNGICGDTSQCLYCTPPTNLTFSNLLDTSVTLTWTEPPTNPQTVQTNHYVVSYLAPNSTWINVPNATDSNTTGWGTGTITYDITGIIPAIGLVGQNINFSVTNDCGGTNMTALTSVATLPPTPIYGCTDNTACNYDPSANTDDGSCDYSSCFGCMDSNYLQYCNTCWDAINQIAVTDGSGGAYVNDTAPSSCVDLIVDGCTDPAAFNYNTLANVDDGTCIAVVLGCTDATLNNNGSNAAANYNPAANTDDGTCSPHNCPTISFLITSGASPTLAVAYIQIDLAATTYDNQVIYNTIPWGSLSYDLTIGGTTINVADPLNPPSGFGISSWATNGSEVWLTIQILESLDTTGGVITLDASLSTNSSSYNNLYTSSPDVCLVQAQSQVFSVGCTDPLANNDGVFDISDDTLCTFDGCTDDTLAWDGTIWATNYDPLADTDDGSCVYTQPVLAVQFGYQFGQTQGVYDADGYSTIRLRYETAGTRFLTVLPPSIIRVDNVDLVSIHATTIDQGMDWTAIRQLTDAGYIDGVIDIDQNLTDPNGDFDVQITGAVAIGVNSYGVNIVSDPLSYQPFNNNWQTLQFGCRDGGSNYVNWVQYADDLMQKDSCILPVGPGCIDDNASFWTDTHGVDQYATNLWPGGNMDCSNVYLGTDNSCCFGDCVAQFNLGNQAPNPDWGPSSWVGAYEIWTNFLSGDFTDPANPVPVLEATWEVNPVSGTAFYNDSWLWLSIETPSSANRYEAEIFLDNGTSLGIVGITPDATAIAADLFQFGFGIGFWRIVTTGYNFVAGDKIHFKIRSYCYDDYTETTESASAWSADKSVLLTDSVMPGW